MKILGHRGSREQGKPYENTYEAIEIVLKEGADGVELDVISSKDNILYLIHDEEISKHSNYDTGNITKLTSLEIDKKRIGKDTPYKIAKLKQVLELFRDKYSDRVLNIEIKQKGIAKEVFRELTESAIDKKNIIVSSFNHEDLYAYRKLDKNITLGILFEDEEGEEYLEYLEKLAKDLGNVTIHPCINSPILSKITQEKYIWTVGIEDIPKLEHLIDANIIVDSYIKVGKAIKVGLNKKNN